MTHTPALRALLVRRLEQEDLPADSPIAVAELHKRLVPYGLCREALGLASKAEYDVALLRLLDDPGVEVDERALKEAVKRELASPEPGLAILQRFAASEVKLGGSPVSGAGPAGAAEPVGPPPFTYETERLDQDRIPGLDDRELLPEPAVAAPAGVAVPSDRSRCIGCSEVLPAREGLRYCPACGADQDRWPCRECGETVERGWRFCAMCGASQPAG